MRSKETTPALCLLLLFIIGGAGLSNVTLARGEDSPGDKKPVCKAMKIFPLVKQHVHGPAVVELPNGDLLAAWFQGSGERWADDVAIMGSRLRAGAEKWSKPFVMADVPGFPDINPILFIDPQKRLWLLWYTVLANQWETSLPKYRISEDYTTQEGSPEWRWQEVLHVKPGDPAERGIQPGDRFVRSIERQIKDYSEYVLKTTAVSEKVARGSVDRWAEDLLAKERGENMMRGGRLYDAKGRSTAQKMGYPYFRRVGWQTRNKATIIDNRRIIVPFYSDGFSFSLMAITDDGGQTWLFSEPLVGAGNIQPAIVEKTDGTLVAYMRDNGPPPQRIHISTSKDKGLTWGLVKDSDILNPGSAVDIVALQNGHWVLAYNDTERGRHSLAVSISTDEGQTWPTKRHIERDTRDMRIATSSAYPTLIQGRNGTLHMVYSYHHKDRKGGPNETIKYFRFNEAWIRAKASKRK